MTFSQNATAGLLAAGPRDCHPAALGGERGIQNGRIAISRAKLRWRGA